MENSIEKQENTSFIGKYAKIIVIFSVLFGATSGIFSKMTAISAMGIGFWRLAIALPFFIVPTLANGEKRQNLFSLKKNEILLCVISGIFLFGHFANWFSAVKLTNIASACVLAALHPVVVILVTIFIYKRKVPGKAIIAILVAILGSAIIAGIDASALAGGDLKGDLMALMAGLFMGGYFAVGDKARKTVDGTTYVLVVFFTCWVCFTISCIVTGTQILGFGLKDYLCVIAMAFLCQIGAHALFNMCIGHVSSLYVSTWETGDPVFSIILAIIFLGQMPKLYEIIGCVIVVGALLYYNKVSQE